MSSFLIRPYRDDDFEAVTSLWRRSRLRSMPEFSSRHPHTYEEDCQFFRKHVLPQNKLWVLELDGQPAAFIAMRKDFIDLLYVDPPHWRKGLGKALLDHARTVSPRSLWLYTLQENVNARAFYEKNGFLAEAFGVSPEPENEPDVKYVWGTDRSEKREHHTK